MPRQSGSSPQTGIAAIDAALPMLRLMGPKGFILVFNMGLRGPQYFHSEYPKAWQREYESRNYTWADPVLFWSVMASGARRWSEVPNPDPLGVMKAARRFGLNYGVILSRWVGTKKSVLTLAREDREFTDEEIEFLSLTFARLVDEVKLDSSLSRDEVETLRCVRDGMSQKEIAAAMNAAVPTVKVRLKRSCAKLGAKTSAQAVALAIERNIL